MTQLEPVTVVAHPNIALIKYWGKRNHQHNLPAAGSISVTLRGMSTTTTVAFDPDLERDVLTLHGTSEGTGSSKTRRVEAFLDRVRERSGVRRFARVTTTNDFPTGAGLASSASGFAALAMAASRAAGLKLDRKQLSILARIGSGSAARSIFGGYVEMLRGELDDGQDCFAQQIAGADHWDLRCVVALAAEGEKDIGSTEAMTHTAKTSPYFDPWIADVERSLAEARAAILARDFDRIAQLAEASCLRMHASALAADPGILYWKGATVELIHAVRAMRKRGTPAFFTIDAGPHVKVFCTPDSEAKIASELGQMPGVLDVLTTRPGLGVRVMEHTPTR